ncbi:SUN domain-containing protein 3-like [Anopheles darlingi]|uniref:SUN domain-containing protein 3-like n=1 Tax=Anopheles darlingi TaxID=43151 RepID=UPI0021002E46|nr:SUN domain-containing protein 3-like [Anopheles darlingi]
MLEKLNFDQFGPTDYAAHRFGGEVISVSSHIPGANDTLMQKFQNMLPSFSDNQKQCILQNCGTCYAILGSKGSVVIRLMSRIWLHSITIEHFPRHAYPRSQTYSAMNEFEVWGTNDPSDPKTDTWYGNFRFEYEHDFLETFQLRQNSVKQSVRYVRVNILSNHGKEYTCIYR